MIDWLEIRDLAIAEHIALEFGDGFTAVTGETGSGKSLIVEALAALLGGRCENAMIRRRQESAEIQGGFKLDGCEAAMAWLRDNDFHNEIADEDASECILRRVVRRDRPSRAYINGRAATAAQLRALGRELVEIHGQNEHHALLGKPGQLALLDGAAGNGEKLAQLGSCHEKLMAVRAQMAQVTERGDLARERAELLGAHIAELESLAPQADEWPRLEAQHRRMHHAQELAEGTRTVAERLRESESEVLAACCRQLRRLAEFDGRLNGIIAMLEEAGVNLNESAEQLVALGGDGAVDAAQIAEIEARFSRYHELARKHRVLPNLLAEKLEQLRVELAQAADPAAELQRLETQWQAHLAEYDELASEIGKRRGKTAKHLSAGVTELMQVLGMAGGELEIRLLPNETGRIARRGGESVEFAVSANPGLPLGPLEKVASGGELSRISLAINVVLAADAPTSTLLFDEVDVGIGGRVAEIVGRKLRQLGGSRQVVCITHLPQVAANGHHHWSVVKQTGRQATVGVRRLDGKLRVEEIARMTAGADLTPQSLAHAERLLQSA